jgi:hypothetical protein
MYRLQAKLLALAVVANGAELSNASDEVEGLFVRESNASTVCGVHDPANQTRLLPLALQGLSEPHTGQVPLAPASRLGRQLLRLVVGVRYKILHVLLWYTSGSAAFSRRRPRRLLILEHRLQESRCYGARTSGRSP